MKKTLPRTPLSSSGDCAGPRTVDAGCVPKHSNIKSVKCRKNRASTGCEVPACMVASQGMVRSTTSQSVDATRYNVARSDGLRVRFCSSHKSRVRANAATKETASEATRVVSSCNTDGDAVISATKYANRVMDNNVPIAYGLY